MQGKRVVVFLGPSLEPETAKNILDAEYRPPASRVSRQSEKGQR